MTWRRAAAVLAVALVVAVGCSIAGVWQWTRHQDRSAAVALVGANYDAEPVELTALLADGLQPDEVWRPAVVRGTYVGGAVLRNRPVAGTPAAHALGVVELTDGPLVGRLVVVDRGWLPAAAGARGVPLPTGELDIVVRLRAAEPPADRDAPAGQVQAIDVAAVVEVAGQDTDDAVPQAYGVVATEDGATPAGVSPLPRPDADLGPHLSYAFQWWVFALGALVGAVVLLRREALEGAEPAGASAATPKPTAAARERARRRRPTAEEEEDAILDAADRGAPGPLSPRS